MSNALLWEAVAGSHTRLVRRRSDDGRCSAITRAGRRCRIRARAGTAYCAFHDPEVSEEQRKAYAAKGGRGKKSLRALPGGYLRKLTSIQAIRDALDRLYREIRVGVIDPETARLMLDVLGRLLDECRSGRGAKLSRERIDRIRKQTLDGARAAQTQAASRSSRKSPIAAA